MINLRELKLLVVGLPSESEITKAADIYQKFILLEDMIEKMKSELAINHLGSDETYSQIISIVDAVGKLSESEKIRSLISQGESKTVEFKETYRLNTRTQQKDDAITTSALKTIVAFLNTNGGTLLIGVKDNGTITGIQNEISKHYQSQDRYLLSWKDLIKGRIGEEYYPFIDYKIVTIDSLSVLQVQCQPSDKGCYLKPDYSFYVRTNPATDKLEGPKLVDYCRRRFKE